MAGWGLWVCVCPQTEVLINVVVAELRSGRAEALNLRSAGGAPTIDITPRQGHRGCGAEKPAL